ncbi:hypothetical protein [Streptomyces sioyaensis]|nr:hypothetical protein [Streptomyces sioyaensis]
MAEERVVLVPGGGTGIGAVLTVDGGATACDPGRAAFTYRIEAREGAGS